MVSLTKVLLLAGTALAFPTADKTACQYKIEIDALGRTRAGESLKMVGNIPELGNWNEKKAYALDGQYWYFKFPVWMGNLTRRIDQPGFEFKLLWTLKNGTVVHEKDQSQLGGVGKNHVFSPKKEGVECGKTVYIYPWFNNDIGAPN